MTRIESYSDAILKTIIKREYDNEKVEAGNELIKRAKYGDIDSYYNLSMVIIYCSPVLREQAAKSLRFYLNLPIDFAETELMTNIANIILDKPQLLNMDVWHCGTTHCLAGWACELNKDVKAIENMLDNFTPRFTVTPIVASAVIPNYAHLFFSDKQTVLEALEQFKKC